MRGTALPSANVVLSTPDGERIAATATNVDGFYELPGLDPGSYRLQISYIGYQTHQTTVELEKGSQSYNVSLASTEQQLDEVQVEAERGAAQREAGLQTVGAADIERIPTPGPGGDLAAYIQTMPGVVSVGNRGGELYIRGGTPSQNLVLVDGLRVIQPFHISNLYSAFSEDAVKSADVQAGGFGAEYMGAVSSVIDVSLRQGNMKAFEGSASVSPFLVSGSIEGPLREGQDSFLAVARHSVIDETASALFNRDVPLQFYDVTTRYSLQLEDASCNITGLRTEDEGQINPNRDLVMAWSNTAIGGRCLLFGGALDRAIDLRVGHTRYQNEAGTPGSPQRSASVRKTYFRLQSEQELLGTTLDYGGRWVLNDYRYNLDERFTNLQKQSQSGGAIQAYASLEFNFGEYLTVTPSFGTHLTVRRLGSPTYEPRMRLTFRPTGTDRQEVSLALGKYNQTADGLTDERDAGTVFTVWRPSGQREPLVQALHGILGYRQQLGSSVTLSAEGFAKNLSNLPVPEWSADAQFDTETTLADGRVYGADFRATYELNALYLFLGYGYSTITYEAARDDLGAWTGGEVVEYAPSHDRRHQLNMVASYEIGEFTANANWEFGSGRPYTKIAGFDLALDVQDQSTTPTQYPTSSPGRAELFFDRPYNARLPAYHRLDLSLERSFALSPHVNLEAKVGAVNAYDRSNVFYYDVTTFERVDQTPLLPYLSVRAELQ